MATVTMQDDNVVIALTLGERALALHGDIRAPLASVRSVELLENPIGEIHGLSLSGFKITGSYVPGRSAIGTFFAGAGNPMTFAVVHHGERGIRIRLDGERFGELIVSCDDADGVHDAIAADLSSGPRG